MSGKSRRKLTINDVVKIKPPGQPDHWCIKPINKVYFSLDMALRTIRQYNDDDDFAKSIDIKNERGTTKRRSRKKSAS